MLKLSNLLYCILFSLILLQSACFESCSGVDVAALPLNEKAIIDYGNLAKKSISDGASTYAHLDSSFLQPNLFKEYKDKLDFFITELSKNEFNPGANNVANNAAVDLHNFFEQIKPIINLTALSDDNIHTLSQNIEQSLIPQVLKKPLGVRGDISKFITIGCNGVLVDNAQACHELQTKLKKFIIDFYAFSCMITNRLYKSDIQEHLAPVYSELKKIEDSVSKSEIRFKGNAEFDKFDLALKSFKRKLSSFSSLVENIDTTKKVSELINKSFQQLTKSSDQFSNTIETLEYKSGYVEINDAADAIAKTLTDQLSGLLVNLQKYEELKKYEVTDAGQEQIVKEINLALRIAFTNQFATSVSKLVTVNQKTDLKKALEKLVKMSNNEVLLLKASDSSKEFVNALSAAIVNGLADLIKDGSKIDNIYGFNVDQLDDVAKKFKMTIEQKTNYFANQAKFAVEKLSARYSNLYVLFAEEYNQKELSAMINTLSSRSRVLVLTSDDSFTLKETNATPAVQKLNGLGKNEAIVFARNVAEKLNSANNKQLDVDVIAKTIGGFADKKPLSLHKVKEVIDNLYASATTKSLSSKKIIKEITSQVVEGSLNVTKSDDEELAIEQAEAAKSEIKALKAKFSKDKINSDYEPFVKRIEGKILEQKNEIRRKYREKLAQANGFANNVLNSILDLKTSSLCRFEVLSNDGGHTHFNVKVLLKKYDFDRVLKPFIPDHFYIDKNGKIIVDNALSDEEKAAISLNCFLPNPNSATVFKSGSSVIDKLVNSSKETVASTLDDFDTKLNKILDSINLDGNELREMLSVLFDSKELQQSLSNVAKKLEKLPSYPIGSEDYGKFSAQNSEIINFFASNFTEDENNKWRTFKDNDGKFLVFSSLLNTAPELGELQEDDFNISLAYAYRYFEERTQPGEENPLTQYFSPSLVAKLETLPSEADFERFNNRLWYFLHAYLTGEIAEGAILKGKLEENAQELDDVGFTDNNFVAKVDDMYQEIEDDVKNLISYKILLNLAKSYRDLLVNLYVNNEAETVKEFLKTENNTLFYKTLNILKNGDVSKPNELLVDDADFTKVGSLFNNDENNLDAGTNKIIQTIKDLNKQIDLLFL